jgi:hypothetical protein
MDPEEAEDWYGPRCHGVGLQGFEIVNQRTLPLLSYKWRITHSKLSFCNKKRHNS